MPHVWFWIYLATINLVSAIVFIFDKRAVIKKKERVPERTLHLLEFPGGVFSVFVFMYIIRHKNRKASYFIYTWVILLIWILLLYYLFKGNLIVLA